MILTIMCLLLLRALLLRYSPVCTLVRLAANVAVVAYSGFDVDTRRLLSNIQSTSVLAFDEMSASALLTDTISSAESQHQTANFCHSSLQN